MKTRSFWSVDMENNGKDELDVLRKVNEDE